MQAYAQNAIPQSRGSITRTHSIGPEAPLRKAIDDDERLLVCASVRFADGTSTQPLWLTDRRFLFTRKQGSAKFLVSVPVTGSALTHDSGDYSLRLHWADDAGQPHVEAFRSRTWKDSLGGGSAAASAGASGGVAGAIIGAAVDAALRAFVGTGGSASRDEALFSVLTAALRTPADVRPTDLTPDSLNTPGGRLLIAFCSIVPVALVIGFGIFAFRGYSAKQVYEHAPSCGGTTRMDCRVLQPAVVINFRGASDRYEDCDLWLRSGDGRTIKVSLGSNTLCASQPLGRRMKIEYFRGSLTGVIASGDGPAPPGDQTDDNPAYSWRFGLIMTLLCAVILAIFGTASLVSIVGWFRRRSLLGRSSRLAGYLV